MNHAEMRARVGWRGSERKGVDALPELAIVLGLGLGYGGGGGHGCGGASPPRLRPRNKARSASVAAERGGDGKGICSLLLLPG
jgi:hypothetical protein